MHPGKWRDWQFTRVSLLRQITWSTVKVLVRILLEVHHNVIVSVTVLSFLTKHKDNNYVRIIPLYTQDFTWSLIWFIVWIQGSRGATTNQYHQGIQVNVCDVHFYNNSKQFMNGNTFTSTNKFCNQHVMFSVLWTSCYGRHRDIILCIYSGTGNVFCYWL